MKSKKVLKHFFYQFLDEGKFLGKKKQMPGI